MKWLEEYGVIILVYVGLFGFYLGPQIYDNLRPAKYDCETITIPYETEEQGEGDIEETIQDGEDGEKEICTPDKSGYDTTEEVTVQPVNEIIQLSYDEEEEEYYYDSDYSARCWDGTYSYSTGRGTCSHHDGVAEWLY